MFDEESKEDKDIIECLGFVDFETAISGVLPGRYRVIAELAEEINEKDKELRSQENYHIIGDYEHLLQAKAMTKGEYVYRKTKYYVEGEALFDFFVVNDKGRQIYFPDIDKIEEEYFEDIEE